MRSEAGFGRPVCPQAPWWYMQVWAVVGRGELIPRHLVECSGGVAEDELQPHCRGWLALWPLWQQPTTAVAASGIYQLGSRDVMMQGCDDAPRVGCSLMGTDLSKLVPY